MVFGLNGKQKIVPRNLDEMNRILNFTELASGSDAFCFLKDDHQTSNEVEYQNAFKITFFVILIAYFLQCVIGN